MVVEDASIVEGVRELRIRSSRGMSRDHIFVNEHQHQSVLKLQRSENFGKMVHLGFLKGNKTLNSLLSFFFSLYSSLVEEDKCDDFTTFMSSSSNIT